MSGFVQDIQIIGPRGQVRQSAIADTGATETVVPSHVAAELGLQAYRDQVVDTDNGPVRWGVARAQISLQGKPARELDVYIATPHEPLAIGAGTLEAFGYKLETARLAQARRAQARLSICEGCPQSTKHPYLGVQTCKVCGCLLALKVRLPGAACPVGMW